MQSGKTQITHDAAITQLRHAAIEMVNGDSGAMQRLANKARLSDLIEALQIGYDDPRLLDKAGLTKHNGFFCEKKTKTNEEVKQVQSVLDWLEEHAKGDPEIPIEESY